MTGTARFAKVIEECGRPEIVLLWTKPERDKPFMACYLGECKSTLPDSTWIQLFTNAGTGGRIDFTDSTQGISSRFYRIRVF